MRADDLAPLFAAPGPGVGFRQGVVVSWDQTNATNQIAVGGAVLSNVPILNTNEASLLAVGDVVGLLTAGSSWFVLGRVTVPGTPAAATAINLVSNRIKTALVDTSEAQTSGTFGDLATVGPEVTNVPVGPSGKMLVIIQTAIAYGWAVGVNGNGGGLAGFAVSGASTVAAADRASATSFHTGDGINALERQAAAITVEGLTPGLHTVTAKYRAILGAATQATFSGRHLTVIGL